MSNITVLKECWSNGPFCLVTIDYFSGYYLLQVSSFVLNLLHVKSIKGGKLFIDPFPKISSKKIVVSCKNNITNKNSISTKIEGYKFNTETEVVEFLALTKL